jgi:Endonuclease NucS
MKQYTLVQILEAQLEDLVRRAPELIEPGLRFVDHQVRTDRGPLDVLLVDDAGALVVAELKVEADDGVFQQAVDYYDYVRRNLDSLARAYSSSSVNPLLEPRLLILAPEFSETLVNRLRWLRIPVLAFSFQIQSFEDQPGDHTPVYREQPIPVVPESLEIQTPEAHYNYITDLSVRELAQKIPTEVRSWDPERVHIDAVSDGISIKRSNRVVAYLLPRRKFFHLGFYDADGQWSEQPIRSAAEMPGALELLRRRFDGLAAR